jgi:hypothetical protein
MQDATFRAMETLVIPKKIYLANSSDPESRIFEDMPSKNTSRVCKFKRDIILFNVYDNRSVVLIKAISDKNDRIDMLSAIHLTGSSPGKSSSAPSKST